MKDIKTVLEKFQYFYPYPVAIVGAKTEGKVNFMSCAWHTALSFSPPLFGILIAKKRLTHRFVAEAGEFTVNFLARDQILLSAQMGRISGHDMDKTRHFDVKLSPAQTIQSPILEAAYAAFECRLHDTREYGDHDLFVGEVLAVHMDPDAFDEQGVLQTEKIKPLLYLGGDFYITTDASTFEHKLPDPTDQAD